MILVVDNVDSFVHNLARYLQRLGQQTFVVRNHAIDVETVRALHPQAIVLSPGPCTPYEAGCSLDLVRQLHTELPILGVCLGHQTIAAALGGRIVRAPQPMHGRTSLVEHRCEGLFTGLTNPLAVCRYHSLVVEEESLPDCLEATARTQGGILMALAHRNLPVYGVQFHPEAILTQDGFELLSNFLCLAGIEVPANLPQVSQERTFSPSEQAWSPPSPVTF